MLDAVSVLRSMDGEEKPMLGRRVVVYGGGNTALDVARTAKRLGASEAIIVYRRTREKMPAHDFELEEALQEGVLVKWLSTIKSMSSEGTLTVEKMALDAKGFPQPTGEVETLEADSLVLALGQDVDLGLLEGVLIKWLSTIRNMSDEGTLTVEKMALDDKGFPQPTGEFETLESDSLVLALGQDVDLSLLDGIPGLAMKDGTVVVGPTMMTGHPGIFAGGDMVPENV